MTTMYTPYEMKVQEEIELWRNKEEDIVSKAFNIIGKPIGIAYEKVAPAALKRSIEDAIKGFMNMLRDASRWTFSQDNIVKVARKQGIQINSVSELKDYDLEQLDKLARRFFTENKVAALLEGAACGTGGIALIAADIPILFGVCFRVIQQIGTCYGFDMEDPDMLPIILSVFSIAGNVSSATKTAAMVDMHVAVIALSKNWTYKKIAESTQSGVIIKLLKEQVKHLPKQIANNITKRKLAQAIPVVSAAIGAGMNYKYVSDVTYSAYMVFRDLYIKRQATASDETIFLSRGLGLSVSEWDTTYFNKKSETWGIRYTGRYEYIVHFHQSKAWCIQCQWDDETAISLDDAKDEAEALIPIDSNFLIRYRPKQPSDTVETIIDSYQSESLKDRLHPDIWSEDQQGTFVVEYKLCDDVVRKMTIRVSKSGGDNTAEQAFVHV